MGKVLGGILQPEFESGSNVQPDQIPGILLRYRNRTLLSEQQILQPGVGEVHQPGLLPERQRRPYRLQFVCLLLE